MALRTRTPGFLCYDTLCRKESSYTSYYVMLPFENLFIQGTTIFLSDTDPAAAGAAASAAASASASVFNTAFTVAASKAAAEAAAEATAPAAAASVSE